MKLGLMRPSVDKKMRKESRLVVVLAIVVVALVMVATHQDKGEYSNNNSWAVAHERFLSK